jgi:hypothetical protein
LADTSAEVAVDLDGLEHIGDGRRGQHCVDGHVLVGERLEDAGVDVDRADDEFG